MKILQVSYSDMAGGADIAAYRLHNAFLKYGFESRMLVVDKRSDDETVLAPLGKWERLQRWVIDAAHRRACKLRYAKDTVHRSLGLYSSGLVHAINRSDADLVHLHWIGGGTLSIGDIARIEKPLIWTMHDMWAFCGCEHYENMSAPGRYRSDYGAETRFLDLDRWRFGVKRRLWQSLPIHIICPSRWMGACVERSLLLKDKTCRVIPNTIDLDIFRPQDRLAARESLGLPRDKALVLFGAVGGRRDPRKGFDLLIRALGVVGQTRSDIEFVEFGATRGPSAALSVGVPVHTFGGIGDLKTMATLQSACDVFVLPSRQDNLPNVLLEALACGTPCVAFDVGGVGDIVRHGQTGFLAPAFDTDALASSLLQVLSGDLKRDRREIRHFVEDRFSPGAVVNAHIQYYEEMLASAVSLQA